jgi:hypothetical protein
MPQLPFKQKLLANSSGELILENPVSLPFKATLKRLTMKVASNCSARLHPSKLLLFKGDELIVDLRQEHIVDCLEYTLPRHDLVLDKGEYRASVISTCFRPGEVVNIEGLLIFAFGLTIAEIEDFQEMLIDFEVIRFDP